MYKLRIIKSCNDLNEDICRKEVLSLFSLYKELKQKYPLSYYYLFHKFCYSKKQRIYRLNNFFKKKMI